MSEPRLLRSQLSCQFQRTSDKPQGHQGTCSLRDSLFEKTSCHRCWIGDSPHVGPCWLRAAPLNIYVCPALCEGIGSSYRSEMVIILLDSMKHLTPDLWEWECPVKFTSKEWGAQSLSYSHGRKVLRCKLEQTGSRKWKQGT